MNARYLFIRAILLIINNRYKRRFPQNLLLGIKEFSLGCVNNNNNYSNDHCKYVYLPNLLFKFMFLLEEIFSN